MGFDNTNTTEELVTIPAISIPHSTGLQLSAAVASGPTTMSLKLINVTAFDASSIVLWLLAVGTVIGGAVWAGEDYSAAKKMQGYECVHGGASEVRSLWLLCEAMSTAGPTAC